VKIFDILGAAFPPVAIEMKFCTAERTHVPVGPAKFDMNRCNESPLRGEKPDFWPVTKFNTGSFGILPVNTAIGSLCEAKESKVSVVDIVKSLFLMIFRVCAPPKN